MGPLHGYPYENSSYDNPTKILKSVVSLYGYACIYNIYVRQMPGLCPEPQRRRATHHHHHQQQQQQQQQQQHHHHHRQLNVDVNVP